MIISFLKMFIMNLSSGSKSVVKKDQIRWMIKIFKMKKHYLEMNKSLQWKLMELGVKLSKMFSSSLYLCP